MDGYHDRLPVRRPVSDEPFVTLLSYFSRRCGVHVTDQGKFTGRELLQWFVTDIRTRSGKEETHVLSKQDKRKKLGTCIK